MAFNYTAIVNYEYRRAFLSPTYEVQNIALRFLKETDLGWVDTVIDTYDFSNQHPLADVVLVQNLGSTFLCVAQVRDGTHFYRSTDEGVTWEELTHNLGESDYVIWLDGIGSSYVILVETGATVDCYISTNYGETWTYQGRPSGQIQADLFNYSFAESNSCLDENGIWHISTSDFDWVPETSRSYYTRSTNLGVTWSDPIVVIDPSYGDDGVQFRHGGVAAYNGHVVVGAAVQYKDIGDVMHTDIIGAVSHDNGITWETQTNTATILETDWEYFELDTGASIWMDNTGVYVFASGYFYDDDHSPPANYADEVAKYHSQYAGADYTAAGSLVFDSSGVVSPEREGGPLRRYSGVLGGNVAYNQTGAALLSVLDVVPVNAVSELRETPYGLHYWYNPLRKYPIGTTGIEVEDIWLPDESYGPLGSLTWTDDWDNRTDNETGLRMSSWREMSVPAVLGERVDLYCSTTAIYQLILYDVDGTMLAIIDDYRSLQFGHTLNEAGFFTLQLSYYDAKRPLFVKNAILEVRRKIPGYLDWYREFIGHCEDFSSAFYSNGNTQFTVVGSGFNGLLGRVIIGYEEGSAEAKKDGAAESVMKEYVTENRGLLATGANGREADSRMLTFSVEGDTGLGNTWSGERAGKNLLETLQDIANFSSIDYNVVVHPTNGIGYYLFETYENQLGLDRTTDGLDSSTGLNAAGNVPHVFSMEMGNVEEARVSEKHKGEINRCFIFGQDPTTGLGVIRYRENTTAIDGEAINIREAMRGGASQADDVEMDALADEYLEENQAIESFEFKPFDTPSSLYGLHYNFGDRVTVKIGDMERNKRLVRVAITVSGGEGGESNKEFEFKDVP